MVQLVPSNFRIFPSLLTNASESFTTRTPRLPAIPAGEKELHVPAPFRTSASPTLPLRKSSFALGPQTPE